MGFPDWGGGGGGVRGATGGRLGFCSRFLLDTLELHLSLTILKELEGGRSGPQAGIGGGVDPNPNPKAAPLVSLGVM